MREASAVAQLNHPFIVDASDYGDVEGVPFLAMEYLDGRDMLLRSILNVLHERELKHGR
jgi:serine/threonine protein kinase